MDRKPQTQTQRYPTQKNYNRNYISELKINNDHIDTIYSDISTGEYEDIINIIDSNKILNFRNKEGETLIHAILKNTSSSLTEQLILEIIEKLVHKNVSINSMNEYNQIPLHLAAKRGFYDIIDYLISLKSDFNKIDNYGNAPVHYLIDNFVSECKEGEYFKISNKKIKKSLRQIKYEQIAEKHLILNLIDELENFSVPPTDPQNKPKFLLEKLTESVKQYKFFKISDINNIISTKKIEIDNLYTKHDPLTLESETKKILYSSITEFYNLYKDYNFENKVGANKDSELVNDETLKIIKTTVDENNLKNASKFKEEIDALKGKFVEIKGKITVIRIIIYTLFRILYFSYYVRATQITDDRVSQITKNIIETLFCDNTVDTFFFDFDTVINSDDIYDNEKQQKFTWFIKTDDLNTGKTLDRMPLTIEIVARVPQINMATNAPYTGQIINFKHIKGEYTNIGVSTLKNKKCLLVPLLNILNYCDKLLSIATNTNFDSSIDNYEYFYLNYIDEIILNIINNFAVFKKIYSTFSADSIIKYFKKLLKEIIRIENNVYNTLITQIHHIDKKTTYDTRNDTEKKVLKQMDALNQEDIIKILNDIEARSKLKIINDVIENIYSGLVEAKEKNNKIVQCTNTHYSLKYLLSLTELFKKTAMDNTVQIDFFNINNFFQNNSKMPNTFLNYITKYFADGKFTIFALVSVKIELLKKYYDYDFNQFFSRTITYLKFVYKKIDLANSSDKFKIDNEEYTYRFSIDKYKTGYKTIFYTRPSSTVDINGLFMKNDPTKSLIAFDSATAWSIRNNNFVVLNEQIPIVSLDNVKYIIQLIAFKIINLLDKTKLDNIITKTQNDIQKKGDIPQKILEIFDETFLYLKKAENEALLKKVIVEKLIMFINSYIKIHVNKEVNELLSNITDKYLTSALNKVDAKIIENVKSQYSAPLKKYTIHSMIPKLLKKDTSDTFNAIIDALRSISSDSFITSGEKKLLLDKCVISKKIDPLRSKLSGKINLRILDRNGNTILNRLIDQYNEYAVAKVLEIDPEIYTYQNNRGQNSISYLYDVLNSIDKKYTHEALDKRIKGYESNLQTWIKSDDSFDEIELDDKQRMIYNVILNSLYLFNECMWMILLKSPNGWKYEDKIKLKFIIAKTKKFNIKEKLLINSLTDADKDTLKSNYAIGSLNDKINTMIKDLKNEINELSNTNTQLVEEKKSFELVEKRDIDATLDPLIAKNTALIAEKQLEIINLETALTKFPGSFNTKIDNVFANINKVKLIKEVSMDWVEYNKLVKDELWNFYLPIIDLANKKNNEAREKYMSFYNYGLLNLDYSMLDDSEIKLLVDYNIKIINNIYGDYYDLEKYEDTDYNYINDIILNIIYLNVVKVVGIEMYSALIEYLANKHTLNDKIKDIIGNYKKTESLALFEVIENLLKNAIWDKLAIKNPEKIKNYQDESFFKDELKSKIKTIFDLLDNDEDNTFINKITKFYTGLSTNIAYNINDELVNFMNDLKKHSLLFGILNLIKNKK